jgi:hypothetical protein
MLHCACCTTACLHRLKEFVASDDCNEVTIRYYIVITYTIMMAYYNYTVLVH